MTDFQKKVLETIEKLGENEMLLIFSGRRVGRTQMAKCWESKIRDEAGPLEPVPFFYGVDPWKDGKVGEQKINPDNGWKNAVEEWVNAHKKTSPFFDVLSKKESEKKGVENFPSSDKTVGGEKAEQKLLTADAARKLAENNRMHAVRARCLDEMVNKIIWSYAEQGQKECKIELGIGNDPDAKLTLNDYDYYFDQLTALGYMVNMVTDGRPVTKVTFNVKW